MLQLAKTPSGESRNLVVLDGWAFRSRDSIFEGLAIGNGIRISRRTGQRGIRLRFVWIVPVRQPHRGVDASRRQDSRHHDDYHGYSIGELPTLVNVRSSS